MPGLAAETTVAVVFAFSPVSLNTAAEVEAAHRWAAHRWVADRPVAAAEGEVAAAVVVEVAVAEAEVAEVAVVALEGNPAGIVASGVTNCLPIDRAKSTFSSRLR